MSNVRAKITPEKAAEYPLSFNEIIGYTPGGGRGRARKGMYEHRSGKILVVFSRDTKPVETEAASSGLSRLGMAMVDVKTGKLRLVRCDRSPDGKKDWRPFTGSITLAGNPHLVKPQPPAEESYGEYEEEYEEDE